MPLDAWLTLLLLVSMFALMAWDGLPAWVIFVGAIAVAMTLRLAPVAGLLKGFANPGVLTVAALFPVAAGMYSTGAISLLSQRLLGNPTTERSASLRILPSIAIGSAFVNNTPMVAMIIPVVRDLRRQAGLVAPSLLMGVSFASILGGNTTLIGGAVNLIVAGLTTEAIQAGELPGMQPLGMFDLSWVGVPAAIAGLLYLIYVAPRLLRGVHVPAGSLAPKLKYLCELEVEPGSTLDGRTIEEAQLASSNGRRLIGVRRDGVSCAVAPHLVLRGHDCLTFHASAEAAADLWTTIGLACAPGTDLHGPRHRHRLVEAVVSSDAPVVGTRIGDLRSAASPWRAALVGLSRGGGVPEGDPAELRIVPGDCVLLEADERFLADEKSATDLLLARTWDDHRVKRGDRAIVATAITVAMIALATSGLVGVLNAALLAVFAMLLTGCLDAEEAWQSVQWKTVIVLGAALGLESATTASGLSDRIAQLCTTVGGSNPSAALAVVFAATVLMTNVISNSATAAFMFPVALTMAKTLGVSFKPFAMIVMIAASCAFVNPAGFQTNLMVQKDGGYGFMDFARVGAPITVIVGVVVVLLAPLVYGF